jgi:amino acid adenylation domain-containing protein
MTAIDRQEATITEMFVRQVRLRPGATALRFRDEEMSYAELDARANVLAHRLRSLGVGAETVVGVCLERSMEMVVALVGILKAGGAYLPVHPDEPAERFRYMLRDADARVLLTHEPLAARLPASGAEVLSLHRDWPPAATGTEPVAAGTMVDNLAYLCYTSGSTGAPKGVSVLHRGVIRLVLNTDYAELGPDETFLQLCSLTFDPATFEIWGALLNGGRLVIYPPGPLLLSELGDCLKREGVTTLWLTTGLFHRMADDQLAALGGLRQLLAGGDVLSPAHINRVRTTHPNLRLVNGYGPTENTTFTTCHAVTAPFGDRVPIGRPIAGTRVYVLDEDLQPVPDGQWGLLYGSGAGLARGYHRRPGFTAERFPPDPFHPGERMYSIGDVVRAGQDGVLEFRGRTDDQVKVGGYRVELGEISSALAGQPQVKEAVVVVREDVSAGEKVLVAYVVPDGCHDNLLAQLRLALHDRLPRHMIPAAIVVMDSLPLTRNEKVDRAALPLPERTPRDVDAGYEPPRTPTEALLADLWADVLAVQRVGVHDDFFQLGGDSLTAADLLANVRVVLGADLPSARLFFDNPTVAGLAALIGHQRTYPEDRKLVTPATGAAGEDNR